MIRKARPIECQRLPIAVRYPAYDPDYGWYEKFHELWIVTPRRR